MPGASGILLKWTGGIDIFRRRVLGSEVYPPVVGRRSQYFVAWVKANPCRPLNLELMSPDTSAPAIHPQLR